MRLDADAGYRTVPGQIVGDPYTGYREVVRVIRAEDVQTGGEFKGSAALDCVRRGQGFLLTQKSESFRKD